MCHVFISGVLDLIDLEVRHLLIRLRKKTNQVKIFNFKIDTAFFLFITLKYILDRVLNFSLKAKLNGTTKSGNAQINSGLKTEFKTQI